MLEGDAIEKVREYIVERYADYPVEKLVARRFDIGWSVFAPVENSGDIGSMMLGRRVFLIGDNGDLMESSSSIPPHRRVVDFHERFGG